MRHPKISVTLSEPLRQQLEDWHHTHGAKLSWIVEQALKGWFRSPSRHLVGNLDDWHPEPLNSDTKSTWMTSPVTVVSYLRNPHFAEGGHQIACGTRSLWVLPDGRTTGLRRSRVITEALGPCENSAGVDSLDLVRGAFENRGVGNCLYRGTE